MKQQLEIKLEQTKPCRRTYPSHNRRARARWWFDQMRAVVENAPEWPAASPAKAPESDVTAAS
jgi:hypothetical protein